MTFTQLVKQVSDLSAASHAYWERERPKALRDYPLVHPGETEPATPPEEARLQSLLEGLPESALYALGAAMLVGQRFASEHDLALTCSKLKRDYGPNGVVFRLLNNPCLSEDLAEGLGRLAAAGHIPDAIAPVPMASVA